MGCGTSQPILTGELPEAAPTFTFGGAGPPRSPEPSRRPSDETTGGSGVTRAHTPDDAGTRGS